MSPETERGREEVLRKKKKKQNCNTSESETRR